MMRHGDVMEISMQWQQSFRGWTEYAHHEFVLHVDRESLFAPHCKFY